MPPTLFKRFLPLCVLFGCLFFVPLLTTPASGSPTWDSETAALVERNAQNPFAPNGIVFVGSSSIRMWKVQEAFPNHRTLNCGFGGSQIRDSITWFERILAPYHPRLAVVYAGGNDLNAGKSVDVVAADARDLFERIHRAFPEASVAFISSAPNPKRWEQIEKVRALNAAVQAIQKEMPFLRYVDVHSAMLGDDGRPLPDIYKDDGLHMNAKGYAIWNRILLPILGPADQ